MIREHLIKHLLLCLTHELTIKIVIIVKVFKFLYEVLYITSLELWPGFITSILQYEQNIMLCAEVSHKVLRKETVLEFMYDLHSKVRQNQFFDEATKKVVGEIVLTRYDKYSNLVLVKACR